jgi:WD40 repeat protein
MYTLERVGNSLTAVSSSSFGASPTQSTTYFAVNNDGTILALGTSDLTTVNIFAVSGVLPTVVEGKFSFTDTKRTVDRPDDHPVFPVLATGSDSGTLELWWMLPEDIPQRPDTRRPAPRATQNVGSRINSVAFHPTELLLATGSNDKTTRVWSFNDKYKELICQATLKHGDDDI